VSVPGFVLVAVLGAAFAAAQDRPLRDPRVFRTGIDVVAVTATVFDRDGRLVAGLSQDAFEMFEDGEAQIVTQFTGERVPVSVGILLDASDSMLGRRLEDARTAVDRFIIDLLKAEDEFALLVFNHRPHFVTDWTQDSSLVARALSQLHPSGATAIYDAITGFLPLAQVRHRQRGALLIISDGADTASDMTLRDVRSALLRSDAFVYAVAIDPPGSHAINTAVNVTALRELTDQSGGRTEVVKSSGDLMAALSRIAEELNHQYLLGYTSKHGADGEYHSIRVRVRGTDDRVRARNGYVSPKP